jgi:hypothetical protein
VKSLPKGDREVGPLETSPPPSSALGLETAVVEIRKDCYKAPRVILVTLKHTLVNHWIVEYFQKLGQVVNAVQNYPVVDIPGYFRMGFCMNTPEIYIWVRQKPSPDFEDFLMAHLHRSLQDPGDLKQQN